MDFKLRTPCKDCPFRRETPFSFYPERAQEIADSLENDSFPCHKTVDYSLEDPVDQLNQGTQHCAGAAIMRFKMNRPGRILQIAERLGWFDPAGLDMEAPVFENEAEFIQARGTLPRRSR